MKYIKLDFTQNNTDTTVSTEQQVTITLEPFRRSWKTSVSGVKASVSAKELLKKWKKKLSCNGHLDKTGTLVFQGDHSKIITGLLLNMGYTSDRILIVGTGK